MAMQQASTTSASRLGGPLLDFSLKLYNAVLEDGKNVFMSPFSVSAALLLANLGSKGETEQEMRKGLGLEDIEQEEVHALYKNLRESLNKQSKGTTTLAIANRLFSKIGLKVDAGYVQDSNKYHGSGLELMDFVGDSNGSRVKINKWVEEQTRDKIQNLLKPGLITADTLMVLVNAIYFKGKWLKPFKETSTTDTDFFVTKGSSKKIKMMNDKQKVRMVKDNDLKCSAVELPYEDGSATMVFIRPDDVEGLGQLEKALTTSKFGNLLTKLGQSGKDDVILGIPKFKMEATYSLVPILAGLGIQSMFVVGKADFSKMLPDSPDAHVSAVIHKAFIELNEEGTEAAAATAVVAIRMMLPREPPKRFILDRPHMFVICDNMTGSVLFTGRYVQPLSES